MGGDDVEMKRGVDTPLWTMGRRGREQSRKQKEEQKRAEGGTRQKVETKQKGTD